MESLWGYHVGKVGRSTQNCVQILVRGKREDMKSRCSPTLFAVLICTLSLVGDSDSESSGSTTRLPEKDMVGMTSMSHLRVSDLSVNYYWEHVPLRGTYVYLIGRPE